MSDVMATAKRIIANVEKVIVGKRRQVVLALVAWFGTLEPFVTADPV